ncbi:DUF6508 domain-containing protein [Nocardia veterana]|uniref:Uncharacterized protein n=1 Tax=Nocardia veterana TaxID=132249 RepID=A0A7X6RJ44_9NOCA|nr:DUF6508 domain-containing protein [Nocardia veterana]NKY87214.1 hypothetical protein [Nocardia veterana]
MTQANPMTIESAEAALARLTAHDRGTLTELIRRVDKHRGSFGELVTRNPDGTPCPPWTRKDPLVDEVVRFLVDRHLLLSHFPWGTWEAGRTVVQRRDRAALAACSAQHCLQYLTLLVRADRFTEGTLTAAFDAGLMQALLHRLHQHTYPHSGR